MSTSITLAVESMMQSSDRNEVTEGSLRAALRKLTSGANQGDELSFEVPGNGRFTDAVKRSFAGGEFDGDYKAFHLAIRELVKDKQRPNHVVRGVPSAAFDKEKPFKI